MLVSPKCVHVCLGMLHRALPDLIMAIPYPNICQTTAHTWHFKIQIVFYWKKNLWPNPNESFGLGVQREVVEHLWVHSWSLKLPNGLKTCSKKSKRVSDDVRHNQSKSQSFFMFCHLKPWQSWQVVFFFPFIIQI